MTPIAFARKVIRHAQQYGMNDKNNQDIRFLLNQIHAMEDKYVLDAYNRTEDDLDNEDVEAIRKYLLPSLEPVKKQLDAKIDDANNKKRAHRNAIIAQNNILNSDDPDIIKLADAYVVITPDIIANAMTKFGPDKVGEIIKLRNASIMNDTTRTNAAKLQSIITKKILEGVDPRKYAYLVAIDPESLWEDERTLLNEIKTAEQEARHANRFRGYGINLHSPLLKKMTVVVFILIIIVLALLFTEAMWVRYVSLGISIVLSIYTGWEMYNAYIK